MCRGAIGLASGLPTPSVSAMAEARATGGPGRAAADASPGGSRREQLLQQIVDYVIAHGIAELTLRRLAESTGSNNRMLLYYFGSREGIIVEALVNAELRFPTMQGMLVVIDDPARDLGDSLAHAWDIIADPANLPFHRLFFQVFGLAGFERDRFADLLSTIGSEWLGHVAAAIERQGLDAARAEAFAHEVVALWRGLQATLIGLGVADGVNRAAHSATAALVARIRAQAAAQLAPRADAGGDAAP
jgi:AcrR family transcriptional regulator